MTAALTREAVGDRRYDATWLLITAVVTAAAHGYAHLIATRAQRRIGARAAVRTVLDEWPLAVGALPSVVLLLGAGTGWLAFARNRVRHLRGQYRAALRLGPVRGQDRRPSLAVGAGDRRRRRTAGPGRRRGQRRGEVRRGTVI